MIEESLATYRAERRAFIAGLKHYYGVDFYQLDRKERADWLRSYIENKRKFFETMMEYWDGVPAAINLFPEGYKFSTDGKYFSFKRAAESEHNASRSKR